MNYCAVCGRGLQDSICGSDVFCPKCYEEAMGYNLPDSGYSSCSWCGKAIPSQLCSQIEGLDEMCPECRERKKRRSPRALKEEAKKERNAIIIWVVLMIAFAIVFTR